MNIGFALPKIFCDYTRFKKPMAPMLALFFRPEMKEM